MILTTLLLIGSLTYETTLRQQKAIIRVLLKRIKQAEQNESDPRLDEMVNRSIEIGRNIENQAEKMNNTTQQTEQNATR